jgi:protoporphyrinogen oxidase
MSQRVAVLGAGISGLASAYYLQRKGVTPVVFEATSEVGGLGSVFRHDGIAIERFYHVMLNSDRHMLRLLRDLNLADKVHWTKTGMGFHVGGKLYPFNTPMDLLRFSALPMSARLRTGMAALSISRMEADEALDDMPVDHFLRRRFGNEAFEKIWEPLLIAKFGDLYSQVPAYWFLSRMQREKGGGPEVKGYVEGGYRGIASSLASAIAFRGGEVRRESLVSSVRDTGEGVRIVANGKAEYFDAVISTLPLPLLRQVAEGPLELEVLVSKEPLQPYYWNAVLHPKFPFQGIVETTRVIPTAWTRGKHIIYLMNYCQPGSESYERPDDLLKRQALNGIQGLYPNFNVNAIEGSYVFRAPYVEPVWPVGYLKQKPPVRIPYSNVFLATTAHAYPQVNAWNTSIGLARQVARETAEHVKTAAVRHDRSALAVA